MRSIVYHPVTALLVLLIAVLISISMDEGSKKAATSRRNVELLEQEVALMRESVTELEQSLEEGSQPFAREKAIRDELRMQLPGEVVLQIADLEPVEIPEREAEPEPSMWGQWREVLW